MNEVDNEKAMAAYINVAVKTVQMWRWRSEGPPYIKVNRFVRYRKSDVDQWLEQNIRLPGTNPVTGEPL